MKNDTIYRIFYEIKKDSSFSDEEKQAIKYFCDTIFEDENKTFVERYNAWLRKNKLDIS